MCEAFEDGVAVDNRCEVSCTLGYRSVLKVMFQYCEERDREPSYYCTKVCSAFGGSEHNFEKCERSCTRDFDRVQPLWNQFCAGGICPSTEPPTPEPVPALPTPAPTPGPTSLRAPAPTPAPTEPCCEKCELCEAMCEAIEEGHSDHRRCKTWCLVHFRRFDTALASYCAYGVCPPGAAPRSLAHLEVASSGIIAGEVSRHDLDPQIATDAVGAGRAAPRGRAAQEDCRTVLFYCTKVCSAYAADKHLSQKCERACGRNFDKMRGTWDKYCVGGVCR